ncbi:MAG: hypothetical protein LBG83_09435 [Oscillospiraceae bacterium]|nr:hypothetical protein [Oscillospiraceae bacterium]
MKRVISVILAMLLLCGASAAGAQAASASSNLDSFVDDYVKQINKVIGALTDTSAKNPVNNQKNVEKALKGFDLSSLTDEQLETVVGLLTKLQGFGVNVETYLKGMNLPIPVKAALHKANLVKYPIWERSSFWNFIFKWLLFGWIWMDK